MQMQNSGYKAGTIMGLLSNCAPDVLDCLSMYGAGRANQILAELVEVQDCLIAGGAPVSEVPLAWRALAETVGLSVDRQGRIVGGPMAAPVGLQLPAELIAVRAKDKEA